MDVREKLVELLDDIQARGEDFTDYEIYGMRLPNTVSNEEVTSHLIAHGVTVQKWIPVTERLPDSERNVLACLRIGEERRIYLACYLKNGVWWDCIFSTPATMTTTHWMPLPEPPKGE